MALGRFPAENSPICPAIQCARCVCVGLVLTTMVAVLTFWLRRRLPYRRMLVVTGVLLGIVLLVMVGEQAQEMQLAHWLPTTEIRSLDPLMPSWTGLWFSVFPTVETLGAQVIAGGLVLSSYLIARRSKVGVRSLGPTELGRDNSPGCVPHRQDCVQQLKPNSWQAFDLLAAERVLKE